MRWRRKWQPTPVFLPGESQGRGSLVGCRLWGRTGRTRLKRRSSSLCCVLGLCHSSKSCACPFPSCYTSSDVFELWCWRRLLRIPWTARRSNQSILKEINPECSLEGLMLKLKLQYFGHLMQRADSSEKTLTLGKIEGRRRRG